MGVPNRTSVIVSDAAKSKDPKQITLDIVIPDALTGKHRHRRHSRSHDRQRNDDIHSEVSSVSTSKPAPPAFVGGQHGWASHANTWVVGDKSPTADDSASQVRGETSGADMDTSAIYEASVDTAAVYEVSPNISNEASRDTSRGKEASEDISSGNEDNSGGNEASEDIFAGNEVRVDRRFQAEPEEAAFATLANFD